jgi:hypothetical protein
MNKKERSVHNVSRHCEQLNKYNTDLLGNKLTDDVACSVRMFQCMVCKETFKRSEGVLLISGLYCFVDVPDTWPERN